MRRPGKWLAAVLLLFLAQPSWAEELVRLGTDGDFPPNAFINRQGKLDGLEPELARQLCPLAGFRCEWVILSFGDLETALTDGRIDAIFAGLANTPERKERMLFSIPYLEPGNNHLIALADHDLPADTAQISIAALSGSVQAELVRQTGATLIATATQEAAWDMLMAGEVDALLGAGNWLASHDLSATTTLGEPIPDPYAAAIAFRPDDTERAGAMSRAIEALEKDGRLDALREKWFGPRTDT